MTIETIFSTGNVIIFAMIFVNVLLAVYLYFKIQDANHIVEEGQRIIDKAKKDYEDAVQPTIDAYNEAYNEYRDFLQSIGIPKAN